MASASRSRFRLSFLLQYFEFVLGIREPKHLGQECQKQPCTNTATLDLPKTMSGTPGKLRTFVRNPLTPAAQMNFRSRNSGDVPFDLLPLIDRRTASETKLESRNSRYA